MWRNVGLTRLWSWNTSITLPPLNRSSAQCWCWCGGPCIIHIRWPAKLTTSFTGSWGANTISQSCDREVGKGLFICRCAKTTVLALLWLGVLGRLGVLGVLRAMIVAALVASAWR